MENIRVGNVELNMQYYSGVDEYTDGDVEDVLLKYVKSEKDLEKVCFNTEEFAIYYHLSKERHLIVEPMEIGRKESVLEIGSGCGAITGALASRASRVDCIDLSKRRSLINAYRHKEQDNIKIYVGNYEDIILTQKYDVITLIGVFEYANYYIHSQKPYIDFLMSVREKMEDNARVYIAIENRLGAKYFAGCKEDHNGNEFSGIEGYIGDKGARTFSYYELCDIFSQSGFEDYRFYFPFPDYKFPIRTYSEEYLPSRGSKLPKGSNYYVSRIETFDETNFWDSIAHKEEFRMFANSFLVELRK